MAVQQWYYRKGNARFGPVTNAELKQLAVSGKLESTDLLRGVGMSEWIPASKVKGLFAPPKPKTQPKPPEEELGLVEEELGLASPPEPKVEPPKPKSTVPTPPKPAAPATPPAPVAPPAFAAVPDASNPFAQFGLEQGPTPMAAPDPFAGAPGFNLPANDPFAGLGSAGSGPSPFDSLSALGSQGEAIYREPTPQMEATPTTGAGRSRTTTTSDGFGPLGTLGLLAAPFGVMGILGFTCGIICAFPPGIIVYFIVSGTSKMSGMFAGNCLLKAKIKNEILSLGYGGLLGIFTSYIFLAGVFWAIVKFDRWINQPTKEPARVSIQVDEEDPLSGQPVSFAEPDATPETPLPAAEAISENEDDPFGEADEKIETKTVVTPQTTIPDDEDDGEAEEDDGLTPEQRKQLEEFREQLEQRESEFEKLVRKLERGISPLEALNPIFLLAVLILAPLFTLINTGLWICITAHATWTANLGHDPTKSGGF